jgi:hypothetical protein
MAASLPRGAAGGNRPVLHAAMQCEGDLQPAPRMVRDLLDFNPKSWLK